MNALSCALISKSCRTLTLSGLAAALLAVPAPRLFAETAPQQNAYSQNAPSLPPPAISISAKDGRYSVNVSHADVQSVLKSLFEQADKQLTFEASATGGDVTMLLKGQEFRMVLDAICHQTFLRYTVNAKTGVYTLARDEAAVAASIARINALNVTLRQQLAIMGLDVPESLLNAPGSPVNGAPGFGRAANGSAGAPGGFGGGGLGGRGGVAGQGGAGSAAGRGGSSGDSTTQQEVARVRSSIGRTQIAPRPLNSDTNADTREENSSATKSDAGPAGAQGPAGPSGAGATARQETQFRDSGRDTVLRFNYNTDAYNSFLQQNGLVMLNTNGQEIPVTEALQRLGRQANVMILVDPSVPRDSKFGIIANLPALTLPESLNLLTTSTHLNWRWTGNRIFVTARPEFQLFWGGSTQPSVVYPAPVPQLRSMAPGIQRRAPNR